MITFSITAFFDPMGDGKSKRKVFNRNFYHSDNDRDQIQDFFDTVINPDKTTYYREKVIKFALFKKTKPFVI